MVLRLWASACLPMLLAGASIQLEKDAARRDVFSLRGVAVSPSYADFQVRVHTSGEVPALAGTYETSGDVLYFRPRFPLQPGLSYRASYQPPAGAPVEALFTIPKISLTPSARVTGINPTKSVLPANLLKLYLHFSAPMSRGEAWRRIHLVDDAGKEVSLPFLEIEEELWDREGRRLTVLFDPGRIKRGLVPHNEAGPALIPGRHYEIVVDAAWPDASGTPMMSEHRKKFLVADADRTPPRIEEWRVDAPAAGGRAPLQLGFPESLDAALLQRLISVVDPSGAVVGGDAAVAKEETQWLFTPDQPWKAGSYKLRIGMTIEDLAGNRIDRAFDVDTFERVEMRLTVKTKDLPFTIAH
ncbi:MAG: hypothetical protein HYZ37_02845 [Candidatus Solibacter usitatus]|nr:hypothetical protein [Candidatus Solibacter usitatus]